MLKGFFRGFDIFFCKYVVNLQPHLVFGARKWCQTN